MNKKDKDREDIIEKMIAALKEHEEPYSPGAWERFSAKSAGQPAPASRRSILPWAAWGAAASVILAVGLFFVLQQDRFENPVLEDLVQNKQIPQSQDTQHTDSELVPSTVRPALSSRPTVAATSVDRETVVRRQEPLDLFAQNLRVAVAQDERLITQVSLETPEFATARSSEESWMARLDPLTDLTPIAVQPRKLEQTEDKWSLGLMVASALTTEKVNVGGGLNVTYQLSDNFSISSGVGIASLGVNSSGDRLFSTGVGFSSRAYHAHQDAPQGFPAPSDPLGPNKPGSEGLMAADKIPAFHHRTLTGVTSEVVALDIPIQLNYQVSKTFYTSVGVSVVGILNENRTNHYLDLVNRPVESVAGYASSSLQYSVQQVYVREAAAEAPLRNQGLGGFLNFSVGRKIPFSANLNLSVEPFFKMPLGQLQNSDMNMTNAGFRLVADF